MFLSSLLADSATWYPIMFDTPFNIFRSVAIWFTLAWIIAIIVTCIVAKNRPWFKAFITGSIIFSIVYAVGLIIAFMTFNFLDDGIVAILFIPLAILLGTVALCAIILAFCKNKNVRIIAVTEVVNALLAALVCMGIHFASGDAADMNWLTNEDVNSIALYVFAALTLAGLIMIAIKLDRSAKKEFDAKSISYAAVCIAMSFALSYLRIVKMPMGGSITIASLLPLMLYAYIFGTRKGVFAGMIYGLMQAIQDNYVLHPAQFLLDYPIAFACIGLAGLFASVTALDKVPQIKFALGAIIAGLGRFVMHFISGVFAFGIFAPEGTPAWLYSLTYQAGYVLPDIAIVVVVGILLFSSKLFVKNVQNISATNA